MNKRNKEKGERWEKYNDWNEKVTGGLNRFELAEERIGKTEDKSKGIT